MSSNLIAKAVSEFDTFRSIKEFLIEPEYSEFVDDSGEFSWSAFFTANKTSQAASFNLFNSEQKNGMAPTDFARSSHKTKSYLGCNFKYNPRYLWAQLDNLNMNDFSDVYRELGIIRAQQETGVERLLKISRAGLVLMPQKIDRNFVYYPSVRNVR